MESKWKERKKNSNYRGKGSKKVERKRRKGSYEGGGRGKGVTREVRDWIRKGGGGKWKGEGEELSSETASGVGGKGKIFQNVWVRTKVWRLRMFRVREERGCFFSVFSVGRGRKGLSQ